jgi:hypothetical protein
LFQPALSKSQRCSHQQTKTLITRDISSGITTTAIDTARLQFTN